tara:strand:+ start:83 stop:643 length:561 start_codon:yes stop_codon:yes gene_type:complete
MEKLIDDVLKQYRKTNLHSEAGRQVIVRAIMKEIRNPNRGFYLNMNTIDGRIPEVTDKEEEAKWVCEHCGKSTFELDYDYIGSGYNCLECDMKATKHFADDFHEGKDGDNDYVYSGDIKEAESAKLAEQIAEGSVELGYIFESPDGGETIYRRQVGKSEREKISKEQFQEYTRNRHGVEIDDTRKK